MAFEFSGEQRRRVRTVALTYLEQNRAQIPTAILSRVVELDLAAPAHALYRTDLIENERIKYHPATDTWSYKPVTEHVTDMKSLKLYFKQRASAGTPVRSLVDAYHGVHQDLLKLIRKGKLIAIHDSYLPGHSKVPRHRPRDPTTQMLARWGQPKWWLRPDLEPGLLETEKEYETRVVKNHSFLHLAAERVYHRVNEGIRRIRAYEANEAAAQQQQGQQNGQGVLSPAAAAAKASGSGSNSPSGSGSAGLPVPDEADPYANLNFVHSIPATAPDGTYTQNDIVQCFAKDRYNSVDLCASDVLFWKDPLRFEGEHELAGIDPELRELWLSQEVPGELQLEQFLQSAGHLNSTEIEYQRRAEVLAQGARFEQQAGVVRQPRKKRRKHMGNHSNHHLVGEKGYEFLSALNHRME